LRVRKDKHRKIMQIYPEQCNKSHEIINKKTRLFRIGTS
jgi:hypothetical protein